jgi:catechol 2,3-dioxygenase-like lactoylglutathione lyase family enzyme
MITGMSHATVYVLDQDEAKTFYTETLGFEVRSDVTIDGMAGARWLTVGQANGPDLILSDCRMGHDPAATEQLRALVASGGLGAGVLETDDCRKTFEELSARGVTFLQEPAERPYGIEAVFRDNSGNWFSLTERKGSAWG